jgi:hypothetical protein
VPGAEETGLVHSRFPFLFIYSSWLKVETGENDERKEERKFSRDETKVKIL